MPSYAKVNPDPHNQTMKAKYFTAAGKQQGEQELPESLFDGEVHEPAMWQAVKAYLASHPDVRATANSTVKKSVGNFIAR